MHDADLLEQSYEIAWSVLERSGDLTHDTSCFLLDEIAEMMGDGERRRLILSNRAIDAYRVRYTRAGGLADHRRRRFVRALAAYLSSGCNRICLSSVVGTTIGIYRKGNPS
jgi:hypothetical protein